MYSNTFCTSLTMVIPKMLLQYFRSPRDFLGPKRDSINIYENLVCLAALMFAAFIEWNVTEHCRFPSKLNIIPHALFG